MAQPVSPGGALLRSSRMFSLPAPLPAREGPRLLATSRSATTNHPIYQAIRTPQKSLMEGDWGLKRPLPLRSTTKTSTPIVRISAIDTYEHITEFESAADHALNLQKFQEMDVTITPPSSHEGSLTSAGRRKTPKRSVFEQGFDEIEVTSDERSASTRWKFNGPWLSGLSEVEFNTYMDKVVRRRKKEFDAFLREKLAAKMTAENERVARENGGEVAATPVTAADITDAQLFEYTCELRQNRRVLSQQLRTFLDLPPPPSTLDDTAWMNMLNKSSLDGLMPTVNLGEYMTEEESPYAKNGPPKTHPSAGLSYNRTSAHIFNHPLYGPQEHRPPVEGRILVPKNTPSGTATGPKLGVGGFVTKVPSALDSFLSHRASRYSGRGSTPGMSSFEPDRVGGSKVWVHPRNAVVTSRGSVELSVAAGDAQAIAIKTGGKSAPAVSHFYSQNTKPANTSAQYGLRGSTSKA